MQSLFDGAHEFDTDESWRGTQDVITGHARRRKRVAVTAGVTLAVLGTGAAAVVSALPVTDSSSVECRAVAKDGKSLPGTFGGQAGPAGSVAEPAVAVDLCATLWRTGLLRPGVEGVVSPEGDADPNASGPYPVPSLVACVDQGGGHAVVVVGTSPADCSLAGLAPLAG
ncbi:hypothetical protein [Lentzea kentuckyensis]|uniref:hypothetical protein n=1 Tax=Lentzea kentuckyensis TaxID=360086 RepID=UPI000A3CF092|nr:hypothetical protein [Lentzea kentuckyensis]